PQRSRHLRKDPHGLHQLKSPCPKKENGQGIGRWRKEMALRIFLVVYAYGYKWVCVYPNSL
ncbi:hypothetical protein, partial [Rhodonellum psychrophilum]|uniref:hypothetical protein n=1 Tax=Rhodonellum psychrophilum TaxID=336828 RepID=UPI000564F42B